MEKRIRIDWEKEGKQIVRDYVLVVLGSLLLALAFIWFFIPHDIAPGGVTGISTVISSKGEVLCELEPLVDGTVIYDVPVNTRGTLYSVIGDLIIYVFAVSALTVLVYDAVVRSRRKISKNIDKL